MLFPLKNSFFYYLPQLNFKTTFMNKLAFISITFFLSLSLTAQKKPAATAKEEPKDVFNSALLNGLQFRSVGPAITSGRIADIAVNPNNSSEYYVAAAAGGV